MAGSTIKVGMDIGDVKAAGLDLIKQLNSQVDATLQLAEAQVKYNKEGKQVATVLKGITEAGDKHVVTLKAVGDQYELVSAKVSKAKTAINQLKSAQDQLAAAEKARAQANAALEVAGRRGLAAQQEQDARDYQRWLQRNSANTNSPSNRPPMAPPGAPPTGGAAGGADDLTKATDKANKAGERLFITWQGIVRLVEAQIIKRIINEIGAALSNAVTDAKNFSIAIAEIRTISQDMPLSVEKWRSEITKLSSAFGQTQKDVANAAYETLSNQVAKGADTFLFLESALKFGAATVSSTTDSVNLLSSAIKSFNRPVEETERIAAMFFKTIDLGRVRARDLADTFGRVGSIAAQAGVKIEEVLAAISVMTRKGVKPADSMTMISNILTALLKPTEEMKKLFQEWGVATGEAAIAAFTFEGVLKKIGDESAKGSSRIAELFPNIRGLRGAFQLAGQGASEYQQDLKQITQAQKQYNEAAKEVLNSPGKQLEIAGQRIKNLFTEDFGKAAVEFLVKMNNLMETAEGKADGLERAIKLIIKGLTITTGLLVTMKVLQIANITSTLTWVGAWNLLTAAIGRAVAAAAAFAPFAIVAAAAFVTHQAITSGNDIGRGSGQIDQEMRAGQDERRAALRKKLEEEGDPAQEQIQKLKASVDTRYQILLGYTSQAVRLGAEMKQRTIDNYKDITDAVKISSKTYFDSITNKINELRRVSGEAATLIKNSLKVSEDLGRRTTQILFDARMKYANEGRLELRNGSPVVVDNQKIEVLQKRIEALLVQARLKAREGTKEAFEESRKLYDDVQKLMGDLFEARTNDQKRIFDLNVERGVQQPTRMVIDPRTGELKAQYEFVAKTSDLEKEMNNLSKERLAQERQFRELQRQRASTAEAEVQREKERLRGLQQAFDTIQKIEVFNKEGKVKDEFKRDPGLAARQFDEQAAKIRSLAGQEGFGTQYTVFQDLQKQRLALVQQVEAAIRQEQAESTQQGIMRSREGTQRLIDQATTQQTQGRAKITQGMEQLERDLAVIEERTLRAQLARHGRIPFTGIEVTSGGDSVLGGLARRVGLNPTEKSGFDRAEPDRQAALAALAAVRQAQQAFNADQTTAKLDILKQKLVELKEAARKYIQTFTGQSADNMAETGDGGFRTQGDRLRSLDVGALVSQEGLGTTAQAQAKLEQARRAVEQLDAKIKELPGGVDAFHRRMTENGPAINESFRGFTASALALTDQMKALNTELAKAARALPQIRGNRPQAEGDFFGGHPGRGHFFGGGVKYFAQGGPVGSDNIPAWLNKDEFIMTGAATKAFAPLLKQMNAYPSRAGSSGGSQTTVGDINISVNGGSTSAHTIQEIGVGLRRAIARGTVKLHG